MAIKNVLQSDNPLLSTKNKLIKKFLAPEIQKTILDLTDTMRQVSLIGMAAPQIGKNLRVFITEIRPTKYRNPKDLDILRVFINPQITWFSKKQTTLHEGCGSVENVDFFVPVKRPEKIAI